MSVFDIDPQKLIEKVALELRKFEDVDAPEWAQFVKSGAHRERPPARKDWWHIRAASILRTIYKWGPIGVSKLRARYGGAKNRGVKPHRFTRASGKVIRAILQQLELADLIKKAQAGVSKGRILTPKGRSLLDKTAISLSKEKPEKEKRGEKNVQQETKSKEKKVSESKQA